MPGHVTLYAAGSQSSLPSVPWLCETPAGLNRWRVKGVVAANQVFLTTYASQDVYDVLIAGNGAAGTVGVQEVATADYNLIDGQMTGVLTPYLYPSAHSVRRAVVR